MTAQVQATRQASLLAYGIYGLPLSFLALPLYILLPDHYAQTSGLSLAWIGVILLSTRLADALWDPWLGRIIDRLASRHGYHWPIIAATPVMCLCFAALFLLSPQGATAAPFLTLFLLLCFFAFSTATIAYHAWGADAAQAEQARAKIVAMREVFALIGMILAAVLPKILGFAQTSMILALLFAAAIFFLCRYAPAAHFHAQSQTHAGWLLPWQRPAFRPLFLIYVCNGLASAITATLMPFFVRDALQAEDFFALYLASYLGAAALGIGFWVRRAQHVGLAGIWRMGMVIAVISFVWVAFLPLFSENLRHYGFLLVAIVTGFALGADLVAPPALLAGVIQRAGDDGAHSGSYFGLWNFGGKLTLALAAGLALPLLSLLGYVPGTSVTGFNPLLFTYALLPCLLKLCALWALQVRGGAISGVNL